MPTLLGPWNVQYPINFVANGDTVHEGFNKHIQEIARIYGLLNALDAGKADTSDLTALRDSLIAAIEALSGGPVPDIFMSDLINHINSDNPHPNLLLTNTKGKLPVARVDGLIPYLEVDAGFANWIKSLIAAAIAGLSGGVEITSGSGYVQIGEILMCFGRTAGNNSNTLSPLKGTFKKTFSQVLFNIASGYASGTDSESQGSTAGSLICSGTCSTTEISFSGNGNITVQWLVIGKA